MPKFNTQETITALVILGVVAGWSAYADSKQTLATLIVGGLLGALNLSPQSNTNRSNP